MFLSATEIELGVLRQGDIIANVHLLGAINPGAITTSQDSTGKPISWGTQNPPEFGFAMVLSHSCELDPDNSIKVTSIILAPLRDVNKATEPSKIQELKDSNIINDATQATFLKYFFVEPTDKITTFNEGSIADFSKCFSLRKQAYERLKDNKVLQLKPNIIDAMALKLALYYHRSQHAVGA